MYEKSDKKGLDKYNIELYELNSCMHPEERGDGCSRDVLCIDLMEFGLCSAVFVSPKVYSAAALNAFILQSVSSLLKSRFAEARTRYIFSSVSPSSFCFFSTDESDHTISVPLCLFAIVLFKLWQVFFHGLF